MAHTRPEAKHCDRGNSRAILMRFAEVKKSNPHSDICDRLRDEVIVEHMSLVRYLAMKFANRGEALDDLVQVGALGLIKAVDRFQLERGVEFTTYASPTITGEIKRHFRDKGWAVRMPRRLQELNLAVNRAIDELAVEQGQTPTPQDLARYLHVSATNVIEALGAGAAYRVLSLDVPYQKNNGKRQATLEDFVGVCDARLMRCEERATLQRAFDVLDARERELICLRFYYHLSQTDIASRMKVSQMHVSRLQQKALDKMRQALQGVAPRSGA